MTALLAVDERKLTKLEGLLAESKLADIGSLCAETGYSFPVDVLENLVQRALADPAFKVGGKLDKSRLDAFLAPRVHAVVRIPRRLAARPGVWAWLACTSMNSYQEVRWPRDEEPNWWRYNSKNLLRNGVARLWWGAELLRNGPDYSLVPQAFASVRWFMFVSELRYSWHREAARAFARALVDRDATDEEANNLSKLFNVYLRTRALEVWDPEEAYESSWDPTWAAREATLPEVTKPAHELQGPMVGRTRSIVEEELHQWLLSIFDIVRPA